MARKKKELDIQERYVVGWAKGYRPTICLDFDGVIHDHKYVKDYSTFYQLRNKSIPFAKAAIKKLHKVGFRLVIMSVREAVPIRKWLCKNNLNKYIHEVNGDREDTTYDIFNDKFWDHNPDNTSIKPIANIYIDDKDSFWCGSKFNWVIMMKRIQDMFPMMNWKA